jgi:hypothetical protein
VASLTTEIVIHTCLFLLTHPRCRNATEAQGAKKNTYKIQIGPFSQLPTETPETLQTHKDQIIPHGLESVLEDHLPLLFQSTFDVEDEESSKIESYYGGIHQVLRPMIDVNLT